MHKVHLVIFPNVGICSTIFILCEESIIFATFQASDNPGYLSAASTWNLVIRILELTHDKWDSTCSSVYAFVFFVIIRPLP